jgi:hypothetical protein
MTRPPDLRRLSESQKAGEAAHWYRLAAEQSILPAQNNLAMMYEQGRGVARNYVQAY